MGSKKLLFFGLVILAAVLIIGILTADRNKYKEYTFPGAKDVVNQYFSSWDKKDYPDMYATISDGFKKLEPTAKDLATFREYVDSQGINGVNIINIEEKSNDEKTASVDYSVKFKLSNGNEQSFNGTFTLKYREGDLIRGWKLVHPYGDKIDTS